MASPSSSSSRPSPSLTRSPLFTPIPELETEEEVEENEANQENHHHQPQPQPQPQPAAARKEDRQLFVLLDKCRPSSRDKPSVVPVDNLGASPINTKTILHSFLLSLTRSSKSPKPPPAAATSSSSAAGPADDWKLTAQELTSKLANANRRRDGALLESARLKASVADLERKLDRLESHCLDLKSQLDRVGAVPRPVQPDPLPAAVSEARAAVRALARSLSAHVRSGRIASVLKVPVQNTATLLVYMEALLNRVFYEDFEAVSEEERGILDPAARCEANRARYEAVRGLSWEGVLSKGTKHYSDGLSRFCDQKMSEVVGLMGWARAWPEGLLQAFFGAAKGVWGVCLLARCVHPPVPIMRVERGAEFDGKYMEDVIVGERVRSSEGATVSVRVMVAPGFYVYAGGGGDVIKCKVVCGCGGGSGESENIKLNNIGCD